MALALALLAPAAPAAAWEPDVRTARAYLESRPGQVSFSVRVGARVYGHDAARVVPSVSLMKTVLLAAYLRRPTVRDRPLTRAQRHLLAPVIRWSNNAKASRILGIVGLAGTRAVAARAGLRDFVPFALWGDSRTSARDQALLFWRIERLLPPRHRAYGMKLLRTVVHTQRWGIAEVAPKGWRLYFKGGWGSGSGAADHQTALLVRGSRRVSLAITTMNNPSHAAGKRTLRGVAARLLRGLE